MFAAFIAALAAAPPPATAHTPAVVAQPDDAAVAEAIALLDEQDFEGETLRTAEMTLELMLGGIIEKVREMSQDEIPDDFVEDLRDLLRDHQQQALRGNMASIKRQAATIYAKEFTRQELARLRELGRDPVAVKARDRSKVITPQMMVLGVREMKATESELEAKIERLVSEHLAKRSKGSDQS